MDLAVLHPICRVLGECASWNLQLDKFSFERGGVAEAKANTLRSIVETYGRRSSPHLMEALKAKLEWLSRLERQHGRRFRRVSLFSVSPLILHLGRASVLENVGVYCDRTTGLPLVPGSSLKGVLSTWATWEANQNENDSSFPEAAQWKLVRKDFAKSDHARLAFGCNRADGSEHAGDIVFVGAFPKALPSLKLDLVNPHHDSAGKDKTRLTPNVFICVQPGTAWDFVFFARPGTSNPEALLSTTKRWLEEALEHMGIGAKTAAGYGRFGKDAPRKVAAGIVAKQTSADDLASQVEARNALKSDFPNDETFKARILDKLNPGSIAQLEKEIATLQKPDNAPRLRQLKELLAGKEYKDLRKRLRDKAWFPKDWLPTL